MNRPEKRWGWALVALVGLNLAVFFVFTLPRTLQQRGLASRRETLGRETELERKRAAAVRERANVILANARDDKTFFEGTVAGRRAALVAALTHIEELATKEGLKVGQQGFDGEPVEGVPLERLVVKMPVEGTYKQFVGLLAGLEQTSHFITLDEIKVRGGSSQQEARLDLELSCYFRTGGEGQP
jgi:Tfp pilus assembly protein PilO